VLEYQHSGGRMTAMVNQMIVEESPGSRKQGGRRKATRASASQSHRNYVGFSTLKVEGTSEKGQSSPLQPPKGSLRMLSRDPRFEGIRQMVI